MSRRRSSFPRSRTQADIYRTNRSQQPWPGETAPLRLGRDGSAVRVDGRVTSGLGGLDGRAAGGSFRAVAQHTLALDRTAGMGGPEQRRDDSPAAAGRSVIGTIPAPPAWQLRGRSRGGGSPAARTRVPGTRSRRWARSATRGKRCRAVATGQLSDRLHQPSRTDHHRRQRLREHTIRSADTESMRCC
jgi:hypothetical protein